MGACLQYQIIGIQQNKENPLGLDAERGYKKIIKVLFFNHHFLILSGILPVLSCSIFPALSAVFTASISGDSVELESVVVVVFSSLLLLQAVKNDAIVKMTNIFLMAVFLF